MVSGSTPSRHSNSWLVAMQSRLRIKSVPILLSMLGVICLLALMGIDATVRSSIAQYEQARLFSDLESNHGKVTQELENLVRDSIALSEQAESAAKRRIPTLEDLRGVAKRYGVRIGRLERKAQSEAKADSRCDYVVTYTGNLRNAVDALHAIESGYRCRISRLALQPVSPAGEVVGLSIQIQVQQ